MKNQISIVALLLLFLIGCKTQKTANTTASAETSAMHYDSLANRHELPILMPYNRVIEPIGTLVKFGNPDFENHSLTSKVILNGKYLVIEGRYEIVIIDMATKKIVSDWRYYENNDYKGLMSTYSGLATVENGNSADIYWSAATGKNNQSVVLKGEFNPEKGFKIIKTYSFGKDNPKLLALPNEIAVRTEGGKKYLYTVLNGHNKIVKTDEQTGETVWESATGVAPYGLCIVNNQIFVTNWGGKMPKADSKEESAGVPTGAAFIDPKTGAVNNGSISRFDASTGKMTGELKVGIHPNAIISNKNGSKLYISNGNSDNVSVVNVEKYIVEKTIDVSLNPGEDGFVGDSPNALALSSDENTLFVANGMDNALAVVDLKTDKVKGFIPTEAYPGGVNVFNNQLIVTNLEGEGAHVNSNEVLKQNPNAKGVPLTEGGAYNSHKQLATVSFINIPNETELKNYTARTAKQNLMFRQEIARLKPRSNRKPVPVPERIGEPSVFKHVLYIIKENRTYDQVFGDIPTGKGRKDLCIFGEKITPNQHQLAKDFVLLDNYHASGKCSAEGHQWTDAGMVTDYVEKNVRAWFRSYPHVQNDAMVYHPKGFIWNVAADHGKSVRIYGEASEPEYDKNLKWIDIYRDYQAGKPFIFKNTTTISRVAPMLSQTFPASDDLTITDQIRADAFIKELKEYDAKEGDHLPEFMVMALSTDHTSGTAPNMPTPNAAVADNDLALGKIIDALSRTKFWKNTVVFVTEDDSQAGWDHISAYRTTAQVISPYSRLKKTISKNYNQTSMLRTIEQILGIPPMNALDASAEPMFECFTNKPDFSPYTHLMNQVPLDEINPSLASLKGKALEYAIASSERDYEHIDQGDDDVMNRILWYYAKGDKKYPSKLTGKPVADDDED